MGDDVVQLLGDAQPFLGEHPGRALVLRLGSFLGLTHPGVTHRTAVAEGDAERPRGGEVRQDTERADRVERGASPMASRTIVAQSTARPTTARRSGHHTPTV